MTTTGSAAVHGSAAAVHAGLRGRPLLKLLDLTGAELMHLVRLSTVMRHRKQVRRATGAGAGSLLSGRHIVSIFEKASTRTRAAWEIAVQDEGGAVTTALGGSHIGTKESISDTGRVYGAMFDGIQYRGFSQADVETLAAAAAPVPVWNGLTDEWHPTQVLADFACWSEFIAEKEIQNKIAAESEKQTKRECDFLPTGSLSPTSAVDSPNGRATLKRNSLCGVRPVPLATSLVPFSVSPQSTAPSSTEVGVTPSPAAGGADHGAAFNHGSLPPHLIFQHGGLAGRTMLYVGDARCNVPRSLLVGCAKLGIAFVALAPRELWPDPALVRTAESLFDAARAGQTPPGGAGAADAVTLLSLDVLLPRPAALAALAPALAPVSMVYTDVWASMGEEALLAERIALLRDYSVSRELLSHCNREVCFLHCLPAVHDCETALGRRVEAEFGLRGMEVQDDVFSDPAVSRVFRQAEFRVHSTKAILVASLGAPWDEVGWVEGFGSAVPRVAAAVPPVSRLSFEV